MPALSACESDSRMPELLSRRVYQATRMAFFARESSSSVTPSFTTFSSSA